MPVTFDEPNAFESEDLLQHAIMLDAVGAGLDMEEMVRVSLQLKRLGQDPQAKLKSVRFFGKFFGMYADYYVFEGVPKGAPPAAESEEGALPPSMHGSVTMQVSIAKMHQSIRAETHSLQRNTWCKHCSVSSLHQASSKQMTACAQRRPSERKSAAFQRSRMQAPMRAYTTSATAWAPERSCGCQIPVQNTSSQRAP